MLASGNGKPMQCVANLLRITRGECVYDRIKGIDSTLIDQPSVISKPLMLADAKSMLTVYEPRVNVDSIDIESLSDKIGKYTLNVDATVTG